MTDTQPLAIETRWAVVCDGDHILTLHCHDEAMAKRHLSVMRGRSTPVKVAIVDAEQLERLVDMASKMPDLIREIADRLENANEDNSIERFAATQVDETLAPFAAWREGEG